MGGMKRRVSSLFEIHKFTGGKAVSVTRSGPLYGLINSCPCLFFLAEKG
jgi:hypothetical protein